LIFLLIFLNFSFPEEEYLLRASKELKIDLRDLCIDKEGFEIYGYGKFRLKIFDNLIFSPIKLPSYMKIISENILNNSDSLWALGVFSFSRIDEGVRRGLIQKPFKNLIDSIDKIDKNEYLNKLLKEIASLNKIEIEDENLLKGLIFILKGIKIFLKEIDDFRKNLKDEDIEKIIDGLEEKGEDALSNCYIEKLIENTDFKIISRIVADLSYFIQKGIEFLKKSDFKESFELNSNYGKIILGKKENNIYNSPPYLLIIEPDGNDEYEIFLKVLF